MEEKGFGNSQKLCNTIMRYILNNSHLQKKYCSVHKNRKYEIRTLVSIIIEVLKLGLSWRAVGKLRICKNIHWNTVYKSYIKLIDDNIIDKCFNDTVSKYLRTRPVSKLKNQMTDTTVIPNKLGEEKVKRNKAYKGKKITKISLITDNYGVPLDVELYSGNKYDSVIFLEQLQTQNNISKYTNNKKKPNMLADKGYDSKKIRSKLIEKGYTPIIPYNKRNTKDKSKIKHLNDGQKKVYKIRIRIEQTFMKLKRYRRVNVRYDRLCNTYKGFVQLALIEMIIKTT